ncbi:SDR family oxidoreductase [Pseudochryseolinea flava]|uniref:Short-chain dehydrogenase n=1 Tax=Pseudochryseolinea flava TaxID=2059302 RepID=A0A364Y3I4_9BACT|nr:SDR family oxidoreductase [Pseudochryseolinea flava]RAW01346.1 short-chain dehydrogenase [Pseudochryseolinea flava]
MKCVLILGASSDIAKAAARQYARKGATIFLAGRNEEALTGFSKDLSIRHNVIAKFVRFDADDVKSHASFYKGISPVPDVVICAFGYLGDQAVAQNNWDECNRIIQANYTGAVSILNLVANDMETRKSGVIIGVSSVAGDRGRQSNYIYGSAKAGFTSYLSGLRNRLFKSGVHVVTVKPGFVDTKMTNGLKLPAPLTAQPDQVASKMINAADKKKNEIYVLWMWRWVMLIIKSVPEGVFKKLKL